jgi:hypothetical protein
MDFLRWVAFIQAFQAHFLSGTFTEPHRNSELHPLHISSFPFPIAAHRKYEQGPCSQKSIAH